MFVVQGRFSVAAEYDNDGCIVLSVYCRFRDEAVGRAEVGLEGKQLPSTLYEIQIKCNHHQSA